MLILGGVHGDETEGVVASFGLIDELQGKNLFPSLQLTVVPQFNVDGILKGTRGNALGVDLNRNLPTKDWTNKVENPRYFPGPEALSEPENQALVSWIELKAPALIFSLHSWKPMLNVNGDCVPEAEAIREHTGYIIEESIGYPTPGCLGTYTGLERGIGTLTYEIERGQEPKDIMSTHVPALLKALKTAEARL